MCFIFSEPGSFKDKASSAFPLQLSAVNKEEALKFSAPQAIGSDSEKDLVLFVCFLCSRDWNRSPPVSWPPEVACPTLRVTRGKGNLLYSARSESSLIISKINFLPRNMIPSSTEMSIQVIWKREDARSRSLGGSEG